MATKLAVAQRRMFEGVFVCKNCQSKIRADHQKIMRGTVKCRKCGKKAFRPIRRK